jgi:hypothetical protein
MKKVTEKIREALSWYRNGSLSGKTCDKGCSYPDCGIIGPTVPGGATCAIEAEKHMIAAALRECDEIDSNRAALIVSKQMGHEPLIVPEGTYKRLLAQAEDGMRWRAIMNYGRVRTMGMAGFGFPSHDLPEDPSGYRHLTIDLWTMYKVPDELVGANEEHMKATRKRLTEYADKLRELFEPKP